MPNSRLEELEELKKQLNDSSLTEEQKVGIAKGFQIFVNAKANVLITGATGCGKSSTINALFKSEKAKVGTGPSPMTMDITKYVLNNLVIWDSPGLGDGEEKDKTHSAGIKELLSEKVNGEYLIDLVLVIIDGSSKDLGTTYDLIKRVIMPNLNDKKRVIVAINQADVAMKGKNWNEAKNEPEQPLIDFLNDKVLSVKKRIKDDTGIDVEPVYYKAGYKEEGKPQEPGWNLSKLLYYIIEATPPKKRGTLYMTSDDKSINSSSGTSYRSQTTKSVEKGFWQTVGEFVVNSLPAIVATVGKKVWDWFSKKKWF